MMLDASAIDIVVQILQGEQFYRPAHQLIYQVILDMRQDIKPIDLVTVKDELLHRKQLEKVGGVEYIAALAEGVPNAANAEYYAKIVRDKAMLRELIITGNAIVREAYESHDEAQQVVDEAEQQVFRIASMQIGEQAVTLKGLLQKTFEQLQENDGRMVTGVDTGYQQLNELTSGFQKSEMIILAARPSMGKTSLPAEHRRVHGRGEPGAGGGVLAGNVQGAACPAVARQPRPVRPAADAARHDLRRDWTRLQLAAGDLEQSPSSSTIPRRSRPCNCGKGAAAQGPKRAKQRNPIKPLRNIAYWLPFPIRASYYAAELIMPAIRMKTPMLFSRKDLRFFPSCPLPLLDQMKILSFQRVVIR